MSYFFFQIILKVLFYNFKFFTHLELILPSFPVFWSFWGSPFASHHISLVRSLWHSRHLTSSLWVFLLETTEWEHKWRSRFRKPALWKPVKKKGQSWGKRRHQEASLQKMVHWLALGGPLFILHTRTRNPRFLQEELCLWGERSVSEEGPWERGCVDLR